MRKQNKSQHEMRRNFKCAQLTSRCCYKPLKVVARYKLSAGRHNPSTTLPEIHHDDILVSISIAEFSLSTGLLQTDNLLNASSASTNQQICQELEKYQNNHRLTLQNLQSCGFIWKEQIGKLR